MRSRTPDRLCLEAVGLARAAAEELAGVGEVGEHVDAQAEGDRVVTHYFACREPAYRGWRWAVTVARASRARYVTVDETLLLPGAEALLAPAWVPWSERLRPGDMGPGDLLPTTADDLRLEPGWTGADEPVPQPWQDTAPRSDEPGAGAGGDGGRDEPGRRTAAPTAEAALAPTAEAEDDRAAAENPAAAAATDRGAVASVALELGLDRPRVPSLYGLETAAERWNDERGPETAMAQAAPARCASCGFLVRIGGRLGQLFGVCSNEYSPADGRVVAGGFGCGGHSEAAVMPAPPTSPPPALDETRVDPMTLHAAAHGAGPEPSGAAEHPTGP